MNGLVVGTRVVAIREVVDNMAYIYGHGVYEGKFPISEDFAWPNPRVKLDNNVTIWGIECWLLEEDIFLKTKDKYLEIIEVDLIRDTEDEEE